MRSGYIIPMRTRNLNAVSDGSISTKVRPSAKRILEIKVTRRATVYS